MLGKLGHGASFGLCVGAGCAYPPGVQSAERPLKYGLDRQGPLPAAPIRRFVLAPAATQPSASNLSLLTEHQAAGSDRDARMVIGRAAPAGVSFSGRACLSGLMPGG
jgi:hypothetical protein